MFGAKLFPFVFFCFGFGFSNDRWKTRLDGGRQEEPRVDDYKGYGLERGAAGRWWVLRVPVADGVVRYTGNSMPSIESRYSKSPGPEVDLKVRGRVILQTYTRRRKVQCSAVPAKS